VTRIGEPRSAIRRNIPEDAILHCHRRETSNITFYASLIAYLRTLY
jgi:hypothetical protein